MPAITVLMAVHNGERFLKETLDSLATQTFEDFEFLIVDDASQDGSAQILAEAADADPRIRILTNETNLGLTKSLNRGLEQARGEYIARIDADDVCLPQRLEVQHQHLSKHPDEVGVVSGFVMIDADGASLRNVAEPLDDWQIRWLLGWNPPGPHPSYFFRRCPDGETPILYDEKYRTAQDFDLWSRLAHFGSTRRLPEALIQYRRHDGAITHSKRHEQAQNCAEIGRGNLTMRLPKEVIAKLEPLIAMFSYNAKADANAIRAVIAGADAMIAHDTKIAPSTEHIRWMKKMTAGLLADAILSRAGGLGSPKAMAAFVWHARYYLPHLARAVAGDPGTAIKSLRNRRAA